MTIAASNDRGASGDDLNAGHRHRAPSCRARLASALTCLVIALPAAVRAACVLAGTSNLPPPAVTYLRGYRAPFGAPARLAVDPLGNVYVTDPGRRLVVVRAPNGRIISRFEGLGHPISVAVGTAGTVYVGDTESRSVTAFDASWQPLLQLGKGTGEFLRPSDLSVDATTGNLYVADSAAHLVKIYSAAGTFLHSFGGHGSDDGQFNFPVAVFVDAAARQVLVADQLNYRIQVFDLAGTFLSCFGSQGSGSGTFNMPQGVVADGHGRIYVADSIEGHIQVLDHSGGFIGFIGDFGEAAGQLRIPMGMVIDPSNRLFVAAANNARLEVFGLDAFADPETVVPATITMQPDPIDRAAPNQPIVGFIEVPGHSPDQLVLGSVVANGVSALAIPAAIGDHDGNGVPDSRVAFDRTALLATLPTDGAATVTLSGLLGTKHFEGTAVVHVTACGPGTICSLGDADPRCNEAACLPAVGCAVQAKPDGTACEDGNACTIEDVCSHGTCAGTSLKCDDANLCTDDTCDPANGCVHTNNTLPCNDGNACTGPDSCAGGSCSGAVLGCDDGNGCSDDTCDPVSGCVHTSNTLRCDDGNACTGPDNCAGGNCNGAVFGCDDGNGCTDDTCNPASGCVHTGNTAPCDDGDRGTVGDVCDGSGTCRGRSVTGNYAFLRWPLESSRHGLATFAGQALVRGDICAESIRVGPFSQIEGDIVAMTSGGRAVVLGHGTQIAGNVVTGGGTLLGIGQATVGGRVDLSGEATELTECFAARHRATTRRADFSALPSTPGLKLGAIQLGRGASRRIPSAGDLGNGQSVIDVTGLRLGSSSTLTLVGATGTEAVIVRVRGRMVLGHAARIVVEGVTPERLIFVIDGSVTLHSRASATGTLFAAGRVHMGSASTINGALLGTAIDLAPSVLVELHPFVGW